jgi:epoxyqueuosine reductase
MVTLFNWEPEEFLDKTQGSPIRRIGHERWLRNIAVGLGNAKGSEEILLQLEAKAEHPSALVREHVEWAIRQQQNKLKSE